MTKPVSVTRVGDNKTLEQYAGFYIIEQRGWRVKITGVGSIVSNQLARTLVDESDIQTILHLAEKCGSSRADNLPEVDIRRVKRSKPFHYSIAKEESCP